MQLDINIYLATALNSTSCHFLYLLRKRDGIEVIYISDMAKEGSEPTTAMWKFDTLQKNINSGKINLLRFNLLDLEVILPLKIETNILSLFLFQLYVEII